MTVTEPVPISWSRLRVHAECPQKGDLLARGMKSPVSDIRTFIHGSIADQLMRRWLSMDEPEPGWMAAHVDEVFEATVKEARETGDGAVKWRSPTDKREVRDFVLELVTRLEGILNRYCLPFDWAPAYRFEVQLVIGGLSVLLKGEIDLLVFDRSGRIAVWDLKATQNNEYWRKVIGQLTFYNIAVAASEAGQLGDWPVMSGLFQPMCDQQVLPVTITRQAIREMGARIERAVRDILAGRLDPRLNDGCPYCEVQQACPLFAVPGGRGLVAIPMAG